MSRSIIRFFALLPLGAILAATYGCSSTDESNQATDASSKDTQGVDVLSLDGADTKGDASSTSDAKSDSGPAGDAGARIGPPPVSLGTAGDFVMLAESAISTVPASVITGDLGLSPAAASFVTGFSLTRAGTYWTAPQVVGKVYAADNDPPTPTILTTAIADMHAAYTDAAGRSIPDFLELGVGAIGGLTLAPGLYKWTSTVTIASDVTLSGDANDTWIFQIAGDLTEGAAVHVKLSGGANAKNVVWQVAGVASLGTTSHFEGVLLSKTAITLRTGASVNGRLLAQTAIDIDAATVKGP